MAAQYELLKELLNSGTKLSFEQDFFFKFYQAFLLKDRWMQYISGVGTTLLVTALALALGVVLGVGATLLQQHFGLIEIPAETFLTKSYPVEFRPGDLAAVLAAFGAVACVISNITVRSMIKSNVKL